MPTDVEYLIFWKDAPGQQVSTVVDAHNAPVLRDGEYVSTNGIDILGSDDDVLDALREASGSKFAITPDLARRTLGWDV